MEGEKGVREGWYTRDISMCISGWNAMLVAVKGLKSFRGMTLCQTEATAGMMASTKLIRFLLIYCTLQKVIQQVHATGPLVSHMDFWASPRQYMRDKDKSFLFFFPPPFPLEWLLGVGLRNTSLSRCYMCFLCSAAQSALFWIVSVLGQCLSLIEVNGRHSFQWQTRYSAKLEERTIVLHGPCKILCICDWFHLHFCIQYIFFWKYRVFS